MRCFLSSRDCAGSTGYGAGRVTLAWLQLGRLGPGLRSASDWREGLPSHTTSMSHQPPLLRAWERTATDLLPPQGDGEINERTFVKFALILGWKEHFSPKYKGDDSLIRSSGFWASHSHVLFLTQGSSLKTQRLVRCRAGGGKPRFSCFQGRFLCPPS